MKGKKEISNFLLSGRWFPEGKTCFLEGIRLVSAFGESRDLVLTPNRSDFVVHSCYFFPESSSWDLQFGHGFRACSLTDNRNKLDTKQKTETNYEIGQMLVSGALDETKTVGKAGADIFAKSGSEKPPKNRKQIQNVSGFVFRGNDPRP